MYQGRELQFMAHGPNPAAVCFLSRALLEPSHSASAPSLAAFRLQSTGAGPPQRSVLTPALGNRPSRGRYEQGRWEADAVTQLRDHSGTLWPDGRGSKNSQVLHYVQKVTEIP